MLPPSECSQSNPSADRRLLYTVKPRKLQSYWMEARQISTRCERSIVAVSTCIGMRYSNSLRNANAKNESGISQVYFLPPKLTGYHSNVLCVTVKWMSDLSSSPIDRPVLKFWWRSVKYILRYLVECANFCHILDTSTQMSNLRSYCTEVHQIFTRCSRSSPLLTRPSALQYFSPFQNAIAMKEWLLPTLLLNWLPWQRPLADRKKKAKSIMYDEITTIW